MMSLFLPSLSLTWREIIRFYRQRSRVVGALLTPLVFWLVIGSGIDWSFGGGAAGAKGGYREYFYPGSLLMILLFTSIFSTISIIEDRREGFLQGVLVAPVSRGSIVLGKTFGACILSVMQGLIFLILAPLAGIPLSVSTLVVLMVVLTLVSFGLSTLGFLLAWRMESIQGFHSIMNLFRMPLWLASGAVFPASGAPTWMKWILAANPLTYSMALIRHAMGTPNTAGLPSAGLSLAVVVLFSLVLFGWASIEVRRPRKTFAG